MHLNSLSTGTDIACPYPIPTSQPTVNMIQQILLSDIICCPQPIPTNWQPILCNQINWLRNIGKLFEHQGFYFVSVVNDLYIFYLCLYWVCLDYYLIFRLCQGCYLIVWLCQECHEPIICNAQSSPKPLAYSSSSDSLLQFVMIIVITNYLILRSCHGCHKVIPLSHRHRRNSYLCIISLPSCWGGKILKTFLKFSTFFPRWRIDFGLDCSTCMFSHPGACFPKHLNWINSGRFK